MKAIVNGKIVLPDHVEEGGCLLFDEKIHGICDRPGENVEIIDARGMYVLPGLFDIHIHGYLGEDASDGSFEGLRTMAEGVAQNGVTAFLPTTMTVSRAELETAFGQIRRLMQESQNPDWRGARALGVNAEGPFINPKKKGAQAEENILPGDAEFFLQYPEIVQTTIAPEMPGNLACVRALAEKGVLVSVGHTAATFEEAGAAFDAGARHTTHLFNAMTPLAHRAPGVVGAALSDARVSCELIADTFHVHSGLFPLLREIKGEKLDPHYRLYARGRSCRRPVYAGRTAHLCQGHRMPFGGRHHRRQRAQAEPGRGQHGALWRRFRLGGGQYGQPQPCQTPSSRRHWRAVARPPCGHCHC